MTDAGRGSLGNEALLTPDEVAAALSNPLPSELLLKGDTIELMSLAFHILICVFIMNFAGTVAHEVMQMQNQLEDKVCIT